MRVRYESMESWTYSTTLRSVSFPKAKKRNLPSFPSSPHIRNMPTETTVTRLIDANALKEIIRTLYINCDCWSEDESDCACWAVNYNACIIRALSKIDSAPTVDTTDDVLARFPKFPERLDYQCLIFDRGNWIFSNAEFEWGTYKAKDFAFGKTPLEAVKKLEASLNPK